MTQFQTSTNGYRVRSAVDLGNTVVQNTLDYITTMELCEDCVDFTETILKISGYQYSINYGSRTIQVS